jgi:phosphocarrier protein HPr
MLQDIMSGASASKVGDRTNTVSKELMVTNQLGIHARPASLFVKTANRFHCNVLVEKDGETVNGKSIMGMMMLAAGPGCKIRVHAEGADALQAVNDLEALLHRKFDEE